MKLSLLILLVALPLCAATLDEIRAEPNLERRSHFALVHASELFAQAKTDYAAGATAKTGLELSEIAVSVQIARDALKETGKDPRRHVKPFKMAETDSRTLLRGMDGLENSMSLEDRPLIAGPKTQVQEIHDQWLEDIISGRH